MTLATITFQNFFRMYDKLAGMTGTAKTEEEEFQRIYNLEVIAVPTYKPVIRDDQPDLVYRAPEAKFKAVIDDIAAAHKRGQPVLVGTVAIETSELVSQLLKRRGIEHEVLNAKNHEREATIIAQAGRPGAVTIATNMAGRGVDILLGGNHEGLTREQLRREGIELSDIPQHAWNEALEMLKHGKQPTSVYPERWAQVLETKYAETERDKEAVRGVGGLYVIGTERHEARRIDNQLRGRAGRLGDPGMSRFYLSLGDDLMRRFGGDRIAGIMARLGVEDDMPIEAGVVSKAIENAQTKVEGYNFDTRKHVLQYDEVVNEQRNRIYDQRRRILTEPSMKISIQGMIEEEVAALVGGFTVGMEEEWNLADLVQGLKGMFHLPADFDVAEWDGLKRDGIEDEAVGMALDAYGAKETELGEEVMRRIEKQILLWAVDNRWVRHLTDLDRLREGIGLQAFAQVDPVVAYKREAFNMYGELMNDIRGDVVKTILTLHIQPRQAAGEAPAPVQATPIARNIRTNRDAPAAQTVRKSGPELGRNDPCWCGSGKKYKNCHMSSDRAKAGGQQVAARERMTELKLGAHMSVAGGVSTALGRAASVGSSAVQVFTKNNRQWQGPPVDLDDVRRWQSGLGEHAIGDSVSHASYLINLASPKDDLWEKSIAAHCDEIRRAHAYAIRTVVLHPGAHMGSGVENGVARIAAALNRIHAATPDCQDTLTLLEIMAGQGSTLGSNFGELRQIIDQVAERARVGICLDTCHAFAAGYDLRTPFGYAAMLEEMDHALGLDALKCWHFNDSKGALGSRLDRHIHIGDGEIGLEAFRLVLNDARWEGIPMLLETPKEDDLKEDLMNLHRLCALVENLERIPLGLRSAPAEEMPA